MGFINQFEKIPAATIRKRLGSPIYCGWAMCGWTQCGEDNERCGVYQQRYRRLDFWTAGYTPKGKKRNFFMKPAWPDNPQYENQQIWRGSFADAVAAWQALTAGQKREYDIIAIRKRRCGYHFFVSQYLKSL